MVRTVSSGYAGSIFSRTHQNTGPDIHDSEPLRDADSKRLSGKDLSKSGKDLAMA
jgi:hypothetical protein